MPLASASLSLADFPSKTELASKGSSFTKRLLLDKTRFSDSM